MGIPKKPLAVSRAKKKLPLSVDWGPGIPTDHLRYINAHEEALIKAARHSKAKRTVNGVVAYADDSASSNGVERGDSSAARGADGPSGVGRGSATPTSTTTTKTTSSASGASSYSGYGGSSGSSNASSGTSRASTAPNAAAAYASSRLNATAGALQSAQQPQSIQGVGGSPRSSPVGSASAAEGLVQRDWFNSQLGSLYNDPAINKQLPNALREGMWNQRISDATRVAKGLSPVGAFGERTLAPWEDAGLRTKQQAAANAARGTGIKTSFHNYGLAADIVTPGMPSYNDPSYKSWEDKFARANADLAAQIPDSYATRWGGTFSNVDPAHFQVGTGSRAAAIRDYGSNVSKEGIRPDGVVGPTAAYGNGSSTLAASISGISPASPPTKAPSPASPNIPRTYASPSTLSGTSSPPVYSENPMQGSQNPMQTGENPQVTKDRQKSYASKGATIGGIIAGPIGTVIGGTLGYQMGKTPPNVRQAIASSPKALNANVQSINTMVEERGGKGNPQMRVTDQGLKDVLTDPLKVTQNPQKYTSLEQMLALLAQGIDPETGKKL